LWFWNINVKPVLEAGGEERLMPVGQPQGRLDEAVALQAKFFSGLANPVRLAIVLSLLDGERSVGELVARLGVSQGHVSNQLACLRWCGYVQSRRSGRQTRYFIRDERVRSIVELGRGVLADNASHVAACTRMAARAGSAADGALTSRGRTR
jgi:DNA-binding transcriptional ArsR family regulator